MHFAFLTRSLYVGGAERQLVLAARALHAAGDDVTVFLFYRGGPLERELEDAGILIRYLEKRHRWDLIGFCWRLIVELREARPDAVHSYLTTANIMTGLAKLVLPWLRVVWGIRVADMDLSHVDAFTRMTYWVERHIAAIPDAIVVNSFAGLESARAQGYPTAKLQVVTNGIDTGVYRLDTVARHRLWAELNIAAGSVLIGTVARLDPVKDHTTFLQAAALIATTRSDVEFVCVGGGDVSYLTSLQKLADRLGIGGRVRWLGNRADVADLFNALDVAVSSSLSEGFPNTVGEALACGRLCVVTDVGDSAAIVGDCGIVVPPHDIDGLAGGIQAALKRLEDGSHSPEACHQRVTERFSVAVMAQRIREALGAPLDQEQEIA